MVKHLATACVTMALLFGGPQVRANNSADQQRNVSSKVADLAREYRELRAKRRQSPPGTHLKELDDSGGRLGQVLFALGVELGRPPNTKTMVVEYLGQPDSILRHREMSKFLGIYETERRISGHKLEARGDREYLIYFWRGWHDFLFFISEKGVMVDHGWWFAYE